MEKGFSILCCVTVMADGRPLASPNKSNYRFMVVAFLGRELIRYFYKINIDSISINRLYRPKKWCENEPPAPRLFRLIRCEKITEKRLLPLPLTKRE